MAHQSEELIIEALDVQKSFGELQILKGISLQVRRGEVVVLIGASMIFSSAVIWGNRLKRWNTMPMSRR